jgi:hypothetical protein
MRATQATERAENVNVAVAPACPDFLLPQFQYRHVGYMSVHEPANAMSPLVSSFGHNQPDWPVAQPVALPSASNARTRHM